MKRNFPIPAFSLARSTLFDSFPLSLSCRSRPSPYSAACFIPPGIITDQSQWLNWCLFECMRSITKRFPHLFLYESLLLHYIPFHSIPCQIPHTRCTFSSTKLMTKPYRAIRHAIFPRGPDKDTRWGGAPVAWEWRSVPQSPPRCPGGGGEPFPGMAGEGTVVVAVGLPARTGRKGRRWLVGGGVGVRK